MFRTAAITGALLLTFGACGGDDTAGNEAFCDATREVIALGDVTEIPPELDTMVEEAPDEIRDAAETIRASFEEMFENQDPSAIQTEEFQSAAGELRNYAVENCEGVTDETDG